MTHSIQLSPIQWVGLSGGSLVIGLVAFIGVNALLNQARYHRGLEAYEQANCDRAQPELDSFLSNSTNDETNDQVVRAKAIHAECNLLNSVSTQQNTGSPSSALTASAHFVQRYPSSPLMAPLRQTTTLLFANNQMPALAQSTSCQQFESLTQHNLVPQANQPKFYQACGKALADSGAYPKAIALYETFLDQYPDHALAKSMKRAYAQALYADAQSKGAGTIPPPAQGGATGDGSTVVEIRNDSPEKMRIVFGGPTPRVEELEPCKDCQTYTGDPPKKCPGVGPVGTYTLDPGQYRIIVKSIGDRTVTPYTGDWPLAANTRYNNCFYIVRRPLGAPPLPDLAQPGPKSPL